MSTKNQRLNASITIGSVLEASVKRNVGFLKTGLSQVGDSIKKVERRQKELGRQRKVLEKQGRSVEHLDREYEQLNRTMERLRRSQERWNRAAGASRRVGASFRAASSDIVQNSRRIMIGASLAGGAIFGVAASTAKLGDDVAKSADKLGIGIAEFQELRYAAERSGVATSAFDSSLEKMTKNIGLALEGTGAQKDALDALGLSADSLSKMLPEEALGLIADRMQGVATQSEKAAIANDIFGRSGIGMLNMLRGGSKGLRDLRDDARRTGYVLSEQAARDAEVFQDTLLDTQLTMKGLKNTVGSALLPVVTQTTRKIGDALIGNRAEVEVWANKFATGVGEILPKLGKVAKGIVKITEKVWLAVDGAAAMVGGYENLGMVLAGAFAARTIWRVARFAWSIGAAAVSMAGLAASTGLFDAAIGRLGKRGAAGAAAKAGSAGAAAGAGAKRGLMGRAGSALGRFALKGGAIGTGVALGLGNMEMGDGTLTPEARAAGPATQEQLLAGLPAKQRRKLGQTQEFDGLASSDKKAAQTLYAARVHGDLPTPAAIAELEEGAAAARQEVEALKKQIAQINPDGPMADTLRAPMEMELGARVDELQQIETELTSAKQRADDLSQALSTISDEEITPEISTESLDRALLKSRKILDTLRMLDGRSASSAKPSATRPNQRPAARALGGSYNPGWLLTGEKGPELRYENRAGFIADNRSMHQLANYADSIAASTGSMAGGRGSNIASQIQAALSSGGAAQSVAAASGEVTQNITNHFHASGVSADELMSIAERKRRTQAQGALFDRAPVSGPFGR